MTSKLLTKLRYKDDFSCLILNAPDTFMQSLEDYKGHIETRSQCMDFDLVHIFAPNRASLDQWLEAASGQIKRDGIFWLSYPKGSSEIPTDINRDSLWQIVQKIGFSPVAMVSIDDTWSAMRLRPTELVGKKS